MIFWLASLVGLAIAYLFGSIPTGYLAGRLLKGIDIREHGSKSTGATNVLRTLGKWPALAVLLMDVLKGAGAILFGGWFYPWLYTLPSVMPPAALDLQTWVSWTTCLAGLAVLLGRGRSIWLNFTGGKSVASGLGVLLAISWPVGLSADGFWRRAGCFSDCFSWFDPGSADRDRPHLRLGATVIPSIAGDRRRHLRDSPPSRQYSATTGREGTTPGAKWPRIENGIANLAHILELARSSAQAACDPRRLEVVAKVLTFAKMF
ncbi:Glycerol-3-phosphate acyltransferase [Ensifer adhaerens]|nr:Glycerol-3-phosphate acyltransferase [Ensifer adhaerens]